MHWCMWEAVQTSVNFSFGTFWRTQEASFAFCRPWNVAPLLSKCAALSCGLMCIGTLTLKLWSCHCEVEVVMRYVHSHSQADVVDVSPGTEYTVTVTASSSSSASSSSNISPGVSRMINTNESGEMRHISTRCTAPWRVENFCFFLFFKGPSGSLLPHTAFPTVLLIEEKDRHCVCVCVSGVEGWGVFPSLFNSF